MPHQGQDRVDQVAKAGAQPKPETLQKAALHRQGDHGDVGQADIETKREAEKKPLVNCMENPWGRQHAVD